MLIAFTVAATPLFHARYWLNVLAVSSGVENKKMRCQLWWEVHAADMSSRRSVELTSAVCQRRCQCRLIAAPAHCTAATMPWRRYFRRDVGVALMSLETSLWPTCVYISISRCNSQQCSHPVSVKTRLATANRSRVSIRVSQTWAYVVEWSGGRDRHFRQLLLRTFWGAGAPPLQFWDLGST